MSVAAGVSDAAIAVREKLRGKVGQTKVKRHWPGKAPEWADEAEDNDEIVRPSVPGRSSELEKAFPSRDDDDDPAISRRDDRRLRRLAELRADNREEIIDAHRRIRQAEIISTVQEENNKLEGLDLEDEDEDALEERRRRIREQLLQREQEEAALEEEEEEEETKEEEEEESEYETDSEEEQMGITLVKPVFIPKTQRDTIAEREHLEEEERQLEEMVKKRLDERKIETKQIVVEEIRKDEQIQRNLEETEANITDVDTNDELNEAEEYEAWKAREIARIKRDREDREVRLKEKEEIEKVRNRVRKKDKSGCLRIPNHKERGSRNGDLCRNIITKVLSSSQMLMIRQALLVLMRSTTVISPRLLGG